eukprot:352869-Chlamydomonas_euryale.AAC.5
MGAGRTAACATPVHGSAGCSMHPGLWLPRAVVCADHGKVGAGNACPECLLFVGAFINEHCC